MMNSTTAWGTGLVTDLVELWVLPGQESVDREIERTVGGFGAMAGARYILPIIGPCNSANCPVGMYDAWEGILRREGEGST